jgi:hypothetical protein
VSSGKRQHESHGRADSENGPNLPARLEGKFGIICPFAGLYLAQARLAVPLIMALLAPASQADTLPAELGMLLGLHAAAYTGIRLLLYVGTAVGLGQPRQRGNSYGHMTQHRRSDRPRSQPAQSLTGGQSNNKPQRGRITAPLHINCGVLGNTELRCPQVLDCRHSWPGFVLEQFERELRQWSGRPSSPTNSDTIMM